MNIPAEGDREGGAKRGKRNPMISTSL